ncbi:MAG: AMP-binding protein, partial [Verrucomicrobia bacterium]|nr:AMP-binding protein [Verrucomicrobiota bacterium]
MNASEFTLYQTISRVARLNPEAPAIMAPGKKGLSYTKKGLSYTRLGELIHLIHAQLNDLGVRRGDRVGVLLPSGAEMATTFLAVASCAVFAPINPRLPPRQLQTILAQIGPKVLIVTAETFLSLQEVTVEAGVLIVEMLPEIGGEAGWFCLRRHGGGVPLPQRLAPGVGGAEALPNDPAILLLSSGTTDRPKLTTLAHEPVCLSSIKAAGFLGLSKADRCLNALPLYHVYGLISGLLMPLAAGGSVVVLPTFNPRQFMDGMDEFRPTWYPGTPAMHQSVLDYMASSGRAPAAASAPIAPTMVEGLEEAFKVPVLVAYAMTEVPHIACNPVHRRKPNSVGISVLPEISIMGEDGYLLPRGAIGEVVVRGPAVCQGYETSQEALGTCGKEGWFHTGDLGWLDEDGYLFLTGRIKEIINRGGQKISPRELDEALLTHPDVREAVAFAVSHATLGEDIAAAVVPKDGRHLNEDELREFVARRLSDFKVPSRIVVVDEIPLGSTGKVQRLGLADKLANKLAVAYEHPAPGLEQLVAGVFQQTLRWPQAIGKNDNFFLLGGDSLRGMQAVAKLSDALALATPPTTLFWKPTVAGLAKQLSTLHKDPSLPWTCLVPLQAKGSKPPFFFVHGWGGGVFFFSGLARLLDADQPSYGLQAIGWD